MYGNYGTATMGGRTMHVPQGGGSAPVPYQGGQLSYSEESRRRQAREEEERRRRMNSGNMTTYLLGNMLGGGGGGDSLSSPQGQTAMLDDTLGGRSKRSPDWQAYGRGAYPTTQNFMATQPKYYNYSGGGPDPDKMMLYPNNPEMWDKNGWIASGDSPGAARGFGERRRAFWGR